MKPILYVQKKESEMRQVRFVVVEVEGGWLIMIMKK
jgi:hypothetical protein